MFGSLGLFRPSKGGGGSALTLSSSQFAQGSDGVATLGYPEGWKLSLLSSTGLQTVIDGKKITIVTTYTGTAKLKLRAENVDNSEAVEKTFTMLVVLDPNAPDPIAPDGMTFFTDSLGNVLTSKIGDIYYGTAYLPLKITGEMSRGTTGVYYSWAPTVTGGYGKKRFTLVGSLPAGLSFSSETGVVSGYPSEIVSARTFLITITDATGFATLDKLSLTVAIPVDDWKREAPVTISNAGGPATTGYQNLIVLDASNFEFSGRADGADLRITDTDKTTLLPFWVESFDATAKKARIWVKADLPANASKTLYLYSNKTTVASRSNGDNVFQFFDDGAGVAGWNPYAVTNPVINTSSGEAIVGDPMVIEPDALTNERGAFYFISASGGVGHVGYFTIGTDGETFTRVGKVLDSSTTSYKRVIKPTVIYWPAANCYYMAATCENDGQNATIGLFKSTSRTSGWTFVKTLMTPDPSLTMPDGSQIENTFIDCPNFLFDGTKLRLYYSANTIGNKEPKYFCVATFADGPESALTRYANNPIAKPNPATSWANVGLGGQAWRKITSGPYAGKYQCFFNAFTSGEVSNIGMGFSDDGYSLTINEADKALPLGQAGSWNRVRNYRACGYNPVDPTAAASHMVFNALGDTETIGMAKFGRTVDLSKWTLRIQGQARVNMDNGAMRVGETRSNNLSYYFLMETAYVPGDNVVIETRARVDALFATNPYFAVTLLAAPERPFPDATGNLQMLMLAKNSNQVRHQNRSGGSWGDEDTVTTTFPPTGVWQKYRTVKRAANMDYEVLSDSGVSLGKHLANTDAPQGAAYPLSIGGQGMEMSFDFIMARKHLETPPTVTIGAAVPVSKGGLEGGATTSPEAPDNNLYFIDPDNFVLIDNDQVALTEAL